MSLGKVPGLNENPDILAQDIPERIGKELKKALTGTKDLGSDKITDKILLAIAAEDQKLAKLGERREPLKREIIKMVDALKKVDGADQDDFDAYGMRITLMLAAAVGGKVLMDPHLAEAIHGDRTLLDALNASLVQVGIGTGMALVAETVVGTSAMVFSWYTSAEGAGRQIADWTNTTEWSSPEMAGKAAWAGGIMIATLSSAYLGKFKEGVREGMRSDEPLPEEDWQNKPIRTGMKHYFRAIKNGTKRGTDKFVNEDGKRYFRSATMAALVLATVQLADEVTNVMGVGEFFLGTKDKGDQIESAHSTLDARQAAILQAIETAKGSTVSAVEKQIEKKLKEEEDGTSEAGIASRGTVYWAKATMWNEDQSAEQELRIGSPFSRAILEMVQDGGVIDGESLPQEVAAIFDQEGAKIAKEMAKIDEMERRLSSMDSPEKTQATLNEIVAELDKVMAALNERTQSNVDGRLSTYTSLNRDLIDFAMANSPAYKDAKPGSIKGIKVGNMSVENEPIHLGVESRSATKIWIRMWHEMGAAAPLTMLALFLVIGLLPTNIDLLTISPWTARAAQKKRAEIGEKNTEHFEPALESMVTALEHYLNQGTAARLLHTEPIDRDYIRTQLLAWMEEGLRPGGVLSKLTKGFRLQEVDDHNSRINALKEIMSNDIRVFHSLLRRLLPGMDILEDYTEGDRVAEAKEKTDAHYVGIQQEKEKTKVAAIEAEIDDFNAAELEPKPFLIKAKDLLEKIAKLGDPAPKFEETKAAIKELSQAWGEQMDQFLGDEDEILGASASVASSVEMKTKLTELSLVIQDNLDVFEGTEVEAKVKALKDRIGEILIHIAVNPHLADLNSFKAPVLTHETAAETVALYGKTVEDLKKKVLAKVEPAALPHAEKMIKAKTNNWKNACVTHITAQLPFEVDFAEATLKQLANAKAKIAAFEKEVAASSYKEDLMDDTLSAKVETAKLQIEAREAELKQEKTDKAIKSLNEFNYAETGEANVRKLLGLILGDEMRARVRKGTDGKAVIQIDKREQAELNELIASVKLDLEDGPFNAIEPFLFNECNFENVANGGKSVLMDDIDDIEPGLDKPDHYVVASDMYGNPVLIACDKGHNDREQNQDTVGLNPHNGAILVVDGIGGKADGGAFSKALNTAFVGENTQGLSSALESVHEKIKVGEASSLDAEAGAAVAGTQITDGNVLVSSYAGDVRVYVFGSNGAKKWASTPQTGDKDHIITNHLGMGNTANLETDSNPVESGDRVLTCTDGVWKGIPEDELGSLITSVDLDDPESVESFLAKLDAASKGGADNRGLSLTVVR